MRIQNGKLEVLYGLLCSDSLCLGRLSREDGTCGIRHEQIGLEKAANQISREMHDASIRKRIGVWR
jgi:hypothetical protein